MANHEDDVSLLFKVCLEIHDLIAVLACIELELLGALPTSSQEDAWICKIKLEMVDRILVHVVAGDQLDWWNHLLEVYVVNASCLCSNETLLVQFIHRDRNHS